MKKLILIAALGLSGPAIAQENADDGPSLMERGAQMLLEGLLREMEPTLDELEELAEDFGPALENFTGQMGPALRDLLGEVEDWSIYEPPEVLENGDIIIRRKPSIEDDVPAAPDADGAIEL